MQRAEKMNILTAVLVLLSLISVSRCQSQDQIECITSKINERAQDIAIACEHVANFSVSLILILVSKLAIIFLSDSGHLR